MKKKNNLNASLLLERTGTPVNQHKGALALAVEKELGQSYAPMHWIYGPRGDGQNGSWPITGVCPVVWGFAGVLYTKFPKWLRDDLLPLAGRIATSVTDANGRLGRARTLGRYAIEESFRLSDFGPVLGRKGELLASYDENDAEAYPLCRDILNSIRAPDTGLPLLATVGGVTRLGDRDHLCALRNSVMNVGDIPALVAEETRNRDGYLSVWDRAVITLDSLLA